MGFGGISIWQLLIVFAIIVMIFGTKKLRNIGGDLGSAIKGFKKAMSSDEDKTEQHGADQAKSIAEQQKVDEASASKDSSTQKDHR